MEPSNNAVRIIDNLIIINLDDDQVNENPSNDGHPIQNIGNQLHQNSSTHLSVRNLFRNRVTINNSFNYQNIVFNNQLFQLPQNDPNDQRFVAPNNTPNTDYSEDIN